MAFIADYVFDNGLTVLDTEADRVDLCTQEPTTYTEATSTYSKASSTSLSFGAPENFSPSGRKVVSAEVVDGVGSGTGTCTHWAVSDVSNTRLLATGALDSSVATASGDAVTIAAITIGIPDAA